MIIKYTTKYNKYKGLTLVEEKEYTYDEQDPAFSSIKTPCIAWNLLENMFDVSDLDEEYVFLLCLNSKNKVVGVFEVSHGSIDMSVLDPAAVFKRALLCNAKSIMLAHNHPSGSTDASAEDIAITKKIAGCGKMLNINLLDHIIIADNYYMSMKNECLF